MSPTSVLAAATGSMGDGKSRVAFADAADVSQVYPITRSGGNYRNDPRGSERPRGQQGFAQRNVQFSIRPDTRKPQFQDFADVLYPEFYDSFKGWLRTERECPDEATFKKLGAKIPCFVCFGNHYGLKCPGCWAETDECKNKVGEVKQAAVAEKYKRLADAQKTGITLAASGAPVDPQLMERLAYVPVSELSIEPEVRDRLLAITECTMDTDVGIFNDALDAFDELMTEK